MHTASSPILTPHEELMQLGFDLEPVPVDAIAVYPDAFGKGAARCVQLAKAPHIERYDETRAYITATASDPDRVAECVASDTCGYLLAGLRQDPAFASGSHPVKVAKAGDHYYPGGSGHHRICIAKRAGIPVIMARVGEFPPDHPKFVHLPQVDGGPGFCAHLRMRNDAPWEGTALYVTQTERTPYAWEPVTYVDTHEPLGSEVWCRPWPSRRPGSNSQPAPLLIRAVRHQVRIFGSYVLRDQLTTEVQLEAPTGRQLGVAEVTYVRGHQTGLRVLYRSEGWTKHDWDTLRPTAELRPWIHPMKP